MRTRRPSNNFIRDPSLVLELPLYKLDGSSFMSKDAYGHLCQNTGALWTPQGRSFDGTDDNILVANHSSFTFTSQNFTLEIWAKITYVADDCLITKGAAFPDGWYFQMEATRHLKFVIAHGETHEDTISNENVIVDGEWAHLVIVRNGAAVSIYKDLIDITATQPAVSDPTTNTRNLYVMAYDGGSNASAGTIGEARIYNRALSPAEIMHNFLATKWRFR